MSRTLTEKQHKIFPVIEPLHYNLLIKKYLLKTLILSNDPVSVSIDLYHQGST